MPLVKAYELLGWVLAKYFVDVESSEAQKLLYLTKKKMAFDIWFMPDKEIEQWNDPILLKV